jgi:hypothetical protein
MSSIASMTVLLSREPRSPWQVGRVGSAESATVERVGLTMSDSGCCPPRSHRDDWIAALPTQGRIQSCSRIAHTCAIPDQPAGALGRSAGVCDASARRSIAVDAVESRSMQGVGFLSRELVSKAPHLAGIGVRLCAGGATGPRGQSGGRSAFVVSRVARLQAASGGGGFAS